MATIETTTAGLKRAHKRLRHATRQLATAQTERARMRHERRIKVATLRMQDEQRACEALWYFAT